MKAYWSDGLRFTCQACGKCCCGEPGIVYFSPEEFDKLATFLEKRDGITRDVLIREYMRPYRDAYTARDDFDEGRCVFFEKGKGCTVYELRPSQCRDFPFWRSILQTPGAWEETAETCPGIGKGKLWTAEEIRAIAIKSRI